MACMPPTAELWWSGTLFADNGGRDYDYAFYSDDNSEVTLAGMPSRTTLAMQRG